MTVRDLIEELREYNLNADVMIAQYQRFGNDFAYSIDEVGGCHVSPFWGDENEACVQLVMGEQFGKAIRSEYDEDIDSLWSELSPNDDDEDE